MLEQKLQVKFKNTLWNAPLVPDSVSSGLNKEEIPSVQDIVLACNNPEVDLLQYVGDQDLRVPDNVHTSVLSTKNKGLLLFSILEKRFFTLFSFLITLIWKKGGNHNSSHD